MSLIDPDAAAYAWPTTSPHALGYCDSTRCGECADDAATFECDSCGDRVEPDEGCFHDGHVLCASCLMRCTECRDAERWVG